MLLLLRGLVADGQDIVSVRLLVCQTDFELGCRISGYAVFEQTIQYIQRTVFVRIDANFEHFYEYPLTGETAIRIIGEPPSVVRCVCLIIKLLAGTLNLESSRNVTATDIRSTLRNPPSFEYGTTRSALFDDILDQSSPSSPIDDTSDFPGTSPVDSFDWPLPSPNDDHWPLVLEPRYRVSGNPYGCFLEYDTHQTSPLEIAADWPLLDPRFSPPFFSLGSPFFIEDLNRPPPIRPFLSRGSRRPIEVRHFGPLPVTRCTTTTTRPTSSVRSSSERLVNGYQGPPPVTTTSTTTKAPSVQGITDRQMNRNQSPHSVTTRPTSSVRGSSERPVYKNSSPRVRFSETIVTRSAATAVNSTTDRHTTSARSVSDTLINCKNPSSGVTTNNTTATDQHTNPYPNALNQFNMSTTSTISSETGQSSDIITGESVNTNDTTVTDRHATPALSGMDQYNMSRQSSSSQRVITNSNTTTNNPANSSWRVLDRTNRRNPSSRVTATTASTATTDRHATSYPSALDQFNMSRKTSA